MAEKKAVLYGINNYGFEFKIPVVIEDWQQGNNSINKFASLHFFASAIMPKGDKLEYVPVAFCSRIDNNLLRNTQLYWTKVCYEDGTEDVNKNAGELVETTKFNREMIEQKFSKEFSSDLNMFVGQPVVAHNNFTGGSASGILMAVEPRKDHSPMAYVFLDNDATFILPVNDQSQIVVYPNFDIDNPVEVKLPEKDLSF